LFAGRLSDVVNDTFMASQSEWSPRKRQLLSAVGAGRFNPPRKGIALHDNHKGRSQAQQWRRSV
jgi:hypothetical protein